MQHFTFAVPTLKVADMPINDQRDMILNQATALIVSEYLGHMNAAIAADGPDTPAPPAAFITQNI
jgi:hypothetical protein